MRVHITPVFRGKDKGDGGVRRVIETQIAALRQHGMHLARESGQADVAIVHIQESIRWLKEHSDLPVIVDCHGMYWAEYEWENWCYKANGLVMETIREADAIIAHSEWVAQAIRRHTMRPVYVIPGAVDIDAWKVSDQPSDYVLWNKTRTDPICDPEPIETLAKMMPEIRFVTTFQSPKREGVQRIDIQENLKVIGQMPHDEAKMFVQQASIYLCTTRETFGVGTLEAMAAGVPIVGWNWGGQREFLRHKEDAWLSNPGDVNALVEGIKWTQENRGWLSARVREIAEKQFTTEIVGEKFIEVVKDVHKKWKSQRSGPRTSIIVTAYNLAKYLPACLASVLTQSDRDWECIIVDDASPDNSGAIADEYAAKDRRVRVIHNKKNQYLAGARNTGILAARGRYILPLDADDMLAPTAVKTLADALDADRSIHVAYGNVLFVDEDGTTPTDYQRKEGLGHSGWPIDFRYEWQEIERNCLPYSSMFRRTAWENTGGYRRRCRTAEDADFWTRLSGYGYRPRMVTRTDTLIYRNRQDSMSREVGGRDWGAWFPWTAHPKARPGGALTETQSPIHSCDPPLVAVIIPIGAGHEELVWDAIDSVDAQTFRQWECIVVNDTGKTLPMPFPAWVKVVNARGRKSRGVAAARNMGIAAAKAQTFLPLDADDYLQPECLKVLVDVWFGGDQKGIIYSDWYDEIEGATKVYHAPDFDARLLTSAGAIHAVTALYPMRLWEELGGFDEEMPAWEDWDFQISAANKGVCSTRVASPLWVYRKDTGYRREANYVDFEDSKRGILKKWGTFFNGSEELMACKSCGGARRVAPAQPAARAAQSQNGAGGAVLVKYISTSIGTRTYRGPSGKRYRFGGRRDEEKYVLGEDADFFDSLVDFRIVPQNAAPEAPETPQLVAEGPPQR